MRRYSLANCYQYLVTLLLACLLLIAGCGPAPSANEQRTPSPSPTAHADTPASSPTRESLIAPDDDPYEVIGNAVSALGRVKSGRFTEMRVSSTGDQFKEVIVKYINKWEVVLPDRYRLFEEDFPNPSTDPNSTTSAESIRIGSNEYKREGDGTWQKETPVAGFLGLDFIFTQNISADYYLQRLSDIEVLGLGTLNGEPVMTYRYKYQFRDTPVSSITQTLAISVEDGLPRKLEWTMMRPGDRRVIKDENTYLFYDFNADIKIEPPAVP